MLGRRSDRSNHKYSATIYECSRSTCKGPSSTNSSGNSSCWHQEEFKRTADQDEYDDDLGCNDPGRVMCTEGASGPLCGTCE